MGNLVVALLTKRMMAKTRKIRSCFTCLVFHGASGVFQFYVSNEKNSEEKHHEYVRSFWDMKMINERS